MIFATAAYIGGMDEIAERITQRLREMQPEVSQAQLARDVGMDPSALSRALNGKRGLAGSEVAALAARLRVSTDWLLLGEEPFPVLVAARHHFNDGAYSSQSSDAADGAVDSIVAAYEQAGDLPAWSSEREVPTDAATVRDLLSGTYGADWSRHFADAIERTFGIDVVRLPLPGRRGLSLKLPDATLIAVPVDGFWGYQNWTIAHELWHVAHAHFTPLAQGPQDDGEAAANAFAAELLMPAAEMRATDWASLDEARLAAWLWESGVSLEALRVRLSYLGLGPLDFDGSVTSLLRRHVHRQNVFDDPVTWRRASAATRRFPARLIAKHEELGKYPATLAWMLGAESEEDQPERRPVNKASDLRGLFGMTPA